MKSPNIFGRSDARRWKSAAVAAFLFMTVSASAPAYAQLSLLGSATPAHALLSRGSDPQHDPVNDVYLVVTAYGSVTGVFVNALGVAVTPTFTIKAAPGGAGFSAYPRAKYSPHVNGGAGGFLVAWPSEDVTNQPSSLRTRVVAYPGTLLGSENVISAGTSPAWAEAGPAIGYSRTSQRFFVVWQGFAPFVIQSRLVGLDGAGIGDTVQLSGGYGRDPGVTWNPNRDEFGVSFSAEYAAGAHSAFVIVPAANPAAFQRNSFNFVPGGLTAVTDVDFNPETDRFVMTWYQAVSARVAEFDEAGVLLSNDLASLSIGSYDGLSMAYNPVSQTFLLVGTNPYTDQLAGAELDSHGVRLAGEVVLGGPVALYTRVGSSQTAALWMTSASKALKATLQGVQTATPPPAPTESRIISLGGSLSFGSILMTRTATRTLTITNTGNTSLTVAGISYPTGFTGNWGSGAIAAGASHNVTVMFAPTGVTSYGGTVTVTANQTSGTNTAAASGTGIPTIVGDFDGDADADVAVYRPSTGEWFARNKPAVQYGDPSDIPVPGDYNGDRIEDIAVYRPSTGDWFVRNQFTVQYGEPGDIPVAADYNGDGLTDIAVYRPSTGHWFVRGQFARSYGNPGDVPVPGDYDGNGTADLAVYRPSTGYWHVRNQLMVSWGSPGDLPVPGDYDGDLRMDVAVYRPSTGHWFVRGQEAVSGVYGSLGDTPVPRDYNGDGRIDVAVYRASTGHWFVRGQFEVGFGSPGDLPIPRAPFWALLATVGDYDGDGKTDVAVYRPSTGQWFVRNKSEVQYGHSTDKPVPADYDGDRVMDIAVYRPSDGKWFVRGQFFAQLGGVHHLPVPGDYNGDGVDDVAVFNWVTGHWFVRNLFTLSFDNFLLGDIPVPADYDGDGITDPAVYRPSTGAWFIRGQFVAQFGGAGYVPVPGDFNGDRKTDIAVYQTLTGRWFVQNQFTVQFGDPSDVPIHGDYNGDGKTDVAVFRPSTGTWYVRGQFAVQYGDPTDIPVVRTRSQ